MLNAFDAYLQHKLLDYQTQNIPNAISWSKVRDRRHYLRHVRPMSGLSGDAESSCDIPALWLHFPLAGGGRWEQGGEWCSSLLSSDWGCIWMLTSSIDSSLSPLVPTGRLLLAGPGCYLPPHEKNQWIILKLLSPFNLDLEFFSSSSATITSVPAASRVHPNKRTPPESPSRFDSMNQSSTQINATFPLSIKVNILSSRDNVLGSGS